MRLLNPFASGCLEGGESRNRSGHANPEPGWGWFCWAPPACPDRAPRAELKQPREQLRCRPPRLPHPPARRVPDPRTLRPWGRMAWLGRVLSGKPAGWTAPSLGPGNCPAEEDGTVRGIRLQGWMRLRGRARGLFLVRCRHFYLLSDLGALDVNSVKWECEHRPHWVVRN